MTKYNKEEIERLVEFLDIMIVTNDWNDPFLFGGKGIDNLKAIRQILEGLEMPDEGVVQKLLDIGIDCQLAIQSGKSNSLEYYKQKIRQLLSRQPNKTNKILKQYVSEQRKPGDILRIYPNGKALIKTKESEGYVEYRVREK